MAGLKFYVPSGEIALTATTAKTVAMIKAAANHRALIRGITVDSKGTVATDTPIKVDLCRPSTDGTFTAVTPIKKDSTADETVQTTAGKNASAEPTITDATDVIESWEVHPQLGRKVFYPADDPIPVPGGTRFAIRALAAQGQTVSITIEAEE